MSEQLSEQKLFCRKCKVELNKENRYSSAVEYKQYICISCEKARVRKYRENNPEKIIEASKKHYIENKEKIKKAVKQYRRKHVISYSKKNRASIYGLSKRDYPINGNCELCKKELPGKLSYHHWDDENPSIGIWVCWHCHGICEAEEISNAKELLEKYITFKKQLQI